MKACENYRVTAVRLVEFHNLGTTTVELPEGGHLFLLGDNGSGKTTLLDAIHLVLTAGRDMEFNSAARVAGAKDSGGRSYQGVVLRYNAVTGRPYRETGITYAALELTSDSGRTLSLAVGLAAEGMDVAIERWGGLASVPIADLPLTVTENGRERAATPSEFKKGMNDLTGGRAYAHINDYAKAVGERLFGGEEKYADVCKLLRTGKAYREIAARAANYDELFRQLLEDPSRDTFEPLLKGLRELEESKGKLEQIDERAKYLTDLQRESDRLADHRLGLALVAWSAAEAMRTRAEAQVAQLTAAQDAGEQEKAALAKQAVEAHAETERLRGRLAELRAKDSSGLVAREKQARLRLEHAARRTAEARTVAETQRMALVAEQKGLSRVQKDRAAQAKASGDFFQKQAKTSGLSLGTLTDALFAVANGVLDVSTEPAFDEARRVVVASREERTRAAYEAERTSGAAQEAADAASVELKRLTTQGESLPQVAGFATVREELRAAMISARPVYELLEPALGCDARHLALLERLLGDDFLATWLVDADQADAVRRAVWQEGTAAAVSERGQNGAADPSVLTPWLGAYLSYEESDPEAIRLVAAQLAAKTGPHDADFLSLKTWSYRCREGLFSDVKPRLIGRKAREAEQSRLVRAAEARVAEAERTLKAAQKAEGEANRALALVRELEEKLEAVRTADWRLGEDCRAASSRVARAEESAHLAESRLGEQQADEKLVRDELDDLRLQMREAGIDESLEKKVASLERKVAAGEDDERRILEACGAVKGRLQSLADQRTARAAEASRAVEEAARVAASLADKVPEGETVADLVRRTDADLLAPNADFAMRRERLYADARVAEATIANKIRDAKGEAYSFSFDVANNIIADRRGSVLREVMADEARRLDELREVIDRRSREVFERIFMGEVMQRLYVNYLQIDGLVKRIQRKLAGRRFGSNRYEFTVATLPEYEGFVDLVRKGHLLDVAEGKDELRTYLEAHREEIMNADLDTVPPLFDYRKWFRFQLKVLVENEEGKVIDRKLKSMGSGGEQAVPNYLLILTVAEFLYHGSESSDPPKAAPLLFDEAFYGIDAARRDQLLAFADDLGLQLFVSSPDQDGVKREIKHSVSLIVVKDENLDVHLSPIHWNNTPSQGGLFGDEGPAVGMTVMEETR